MLRNGLMIALLLALLAGGGAALAQDAAPSGAPATFGTVTLNGNFVLDPFLITVVGGGADPAADLGVNCAGYVPPNPTLTLTLRDGPTEGLRIFAYSDADPILVVQLPSGEFVCNDDTGPLVVDPTVEIPSAEAGDYHIWLGAYEQYQLSPAFLVITHSETVTAARFALASLVQRAPAGDVALNLGAQLSAGLRTVAGAALSTTLDPTAAPQVFEDASGGGGILAFETDTRGLHCAGYVSGQPTLNVTVPANTPLLQVVFESTSDSTLVVVSPTGRLYCNDDASTGNLNPALYIPAPEEGIYAVFVGTFDPATLNTGRLIIAGSTEIDEAVLESPAPSGGQ